MKEFKITPEIMNLFRNETVSAKSVKRLIPNYLEYQIKKPEIVNSKCIMTTSRELGKYLCGSHFVTAQRFLDDIQFILETEGLLTNSQEVFHFDGHNLDDGYSYYEVYETAEKRYIETEASVLERICTEIREAKKKEKLESKSIGITTAMLNEIANNPILMNKLLELKGI